MTKIDELGPQQAISIRICGCGTNHNAIDTALGILKQHLTPVDGEMCAIYAAGVVEAMQVMVSQMVQAAIRTQPDLTHLPDEAKTDAAVSALTSIHRDIYTGFYKNDGANERLASFLVDDCGAHEADREGIKKGPSLRGIVEAGYQLSPEDAAKVKQAAIEMLFGKPKG